jgi:hypothetical protein
VQAVQRSAALERERMPAPPLHEPLPNWRAPDMGRRSHKPDSASRRQVEALAGYGIPELDIAGVIEIDPKTLRKHYRHELDHGHVKANAKVAENLYRKATGEGREAVVAAIFWLKTRAGWQENGVTAPPINLVMSWADSQL